MELRIQYVRAADGIRIAFGTAGEGRVLVRVSTAPFSHCQLEWQDNAFFERLTKGRKVVTFDARGTGLSDRAVSDFSLDARLLDLEAVVDHLGLETFALHGILFSGALAVAYTARHPERVSHLILDDTFARTADYFAVPQSQAFGALTRDWKAFTEYLAFTQYGMGRDEAERFAERYLRACVTPEAAGVMWTAMGAVDVTDLLPSVQVPTLLMQHSGGGLGFVDMARDLAARIPMARLVVLEGIQTDDTDRILRSISEFLQDVDVDERAVAAAPTAASGAFRTILFTDIVGHTEMMQRLGDAKGRDVLREHERITRETLRQHRGAEVKTDGDSFMASFTSATKAVECAIALQRAFAAHNETSGEPILIRAGLNAGEPIAEDGDYFGTAVILAARIAAQAGAGEILASVAVRELCAGKNFLFADRGESVLRGFEDPVRMYELRWRE